MDIMGKPVLIFCHIIFIGAFILRNSFVLMRTKIASNTNDTDSKIAEDEQNSQTTNFFTYKYFEENQNNILDGLLTFYKIIGVVRLLISST